MLKLVTWDLRDEHGYHAEILNGPFVKTAAIYQGQYSKEIVKAIENLPKKPGHTYLLINAMGAGEFYGPNKNNDYFPEKVLREYHKTFEALAYVYKHHVNKDPLRSYGKVLFSYYNDRMHRVELIVEVANEKAPDIIDRISKGDHVAVSMGCKVPWDECNICGNRAKTREEYCEHLQRGVAGVTQPNGARPYSINWQPKFFDISFVTIPADPTASVMAKVAAYRSHVIHGLDSVTAMDDLLKAAKVKHADIDKVVEGDVVAASDDPKGLLPASQPDLPLDELKAVALEHKLNKILSTLLAMRIMPKMRDFQRLVLHSTGQGALSDQCDRCGYLFPVNPDVTPIMPGDVDLNYADGDLARSLAHWMPQRSLSKPLVIVRVLEKMAAETQQPQEPTMAVRDKLKSKLSRKFYTPEQDRLRYLGEGFEESTNNLVLKQTLARRENEKGASLAENLPLLGGMGTIYMGNKMIANNAQAQPASTEPAPTAPPAPTKNPFFAITGLGALYIGFQRLMNMGAARDIPKLERTFIQNPWMLPILAGAVGLGTSLALSKKASVAYEVPAKRYALGGIKTILAAAVPSYYYSGLQETKVQRGEQIGQVQDFMRRHPFVTTLAGIGGIRLGLGALNKHASLQEVIASMDEDTINKLYFDLTS